MEDLVDDIDELKEDIDDLIDGSNSNDNGTQQVISNYIPPPSSSSSKGSKIVIEPLELPTNGLVQSEETTTWESVRVVALMVAGIVLLVALILFLFVVLLKK